MWLLHYFRLIFFCLNYVRESTLIISSDWFAVFLAFLKDSYFEIVQELKNWISERLVDYQYSKDDIFSKVDDINYKFTDREK
jgi:hypothetical protein